jgi:hypothetical protein
VLLLLLLLLLYVVTGALAWHMRRPVPAVVPWTRAFRS